MGVFFCRNGVLLLAFTTEMEIRVLLLVIRITPNWTCIVGDFREFRALNCAASVQLVGTMALTYFDFYSVSTTANLNGFPKKIILKPENWFCLNNSRNSLEFGRVGLPFVIQHDLYPPHRLQFKFVIGTPSEIIELITLANCNGIQKTAQNIAMRRRSVALQVQSSKTVQSCP